MIPTRLLKKPMGAVLGVLMLFHAGCAQEAETPAPTGQVMLAPTQEVSNQMKDVMKAALPDQSATLDIVGVRTGIPMTVNPDGTVTGTVEGIPVGTWTFRITYKARHKPDEQVPLVVVAEASKVGTVEANKDNAIQLDWLKTNFFDDNDPATNLEEVSAGTDPQNSGDWPVLRVAVEAGGSHSLALKKDDDTARAWGRNAEGQLGNNLLPDSQNCIGASQDSAGGCPKPTLVGRVPGSSQTFFTNVKAVSAGENHSLGLKQDGTIWSWGSDYFGQLGNDAQIQTRPVQVLGPGGSGVLTDVRAVSAGNIHSLGLKRDGTVWAWGNDLAGQLGNDAMLANQPTPVQVVAGAGGGGVLTGVVAVSAGGRHSLALKSNGEVWAWGRNSEGQLGNKQLPDSQNCSGAQDSVGGCRMPVQVLGAGGNGVLTNVVAVSAGGNHSLSLKQDGTAWAWGSNSSGQLGTTEISTSGTGNQNTIPVQVLGPGGNGVLTDVRAVSAGGSYSLALKGDGTVWAWGSNGFGQLGNITISLGGSSPTPVQVAGPGGNGVLTDVMAVSAGDYHSLALRRDGTIWAWGNDLSGQLGNDLLLSTMQTPVMVFGMP